MIMNYPIQSLTFIAPLFFMLLMLGIPVVGVFAGWKRAAYWGGGTFFFFLLGVIIWKAGGQGMSNAVVNLLNNWLNGTGATITSKLAASLAAPFIFLIITLIGEIILIINYYTWFKRVSGIKKDIEIKKQYKQQKAKKKKLPKNAKGWSAMQLTTKGKIINMACGGAGMALLIAPSSVAFTQALMYTTTSVSTRANSKFSSALYNSLQGTAAAFSWMSYYGNADTGKDYESLFGLLALSNQQVTYTYYDATGNLQTGTGSIAEAMTNVISGGIQTVIKQTTEGGDTKEEKVTAAETSITNFAHQWNGLIANNQDPVNAVFGSENVSDVLKTVIGTNVKEKQTLTADQIKNDYLSTNSVFQTVYNNYAGRAEADKLIQVPVSQTTFNNIVDSLNSTFEFSSDVTDTVKEQFEDKLADIASMLFKVA